MPLQAAGNLSVLFDVGGVLGGIAAGLLSDRTGANARVSCGFVLMAMPAMLLYRTFGATCMAVNIALMMGAGFFVNGELDWSTQHGTCRAKLEHVNSL